MKKNNISEFNESKAIFAIKDLIELISIQTKNNIVEKSRSMQIDKKDLESIVTVIDASIMNAFTNGIDSVIKKLKN